MEFPSKSITLKYRDVLDAEHSRLSACIYVVVEGLLCSTVANFTMNWLVFFKLAAENQVCFVSHTQNLQNLLVSWILSFWYATHLIHTHTENCKYISFHHQHQHQHQHNINIVVVDIVVSVSKIVGSCRLPNVMFLFSHFYYYRIFRMKRSQIARHHKK